MYLKEKHYPMKLNITVLHLVKNMLGKKEKITEVPEMPCPLSKESFNLFQPQVISFDQSDCHGIGLYIKVVEIIHGLVLQNQVQKSNFCWLIRGSALFQKPEPMKTKSSKYNSY